MKKKRSKKTMWIILSVVAVIIVSILIFFNIPYSKTRNAFNNTIKSLTSNIKSNSNVFTEEDIKDLPQPVQNYYRYCGYIGKPKMSYIKIFFDNIDFYMTNGGKQTKISIDYTQYNFASAPSRFAYIDSNIYGLPFEGFDSFHNGNGRMEGVLGKIVTLFDQTGDNMDKASLVTFLSESLILPTAGIQEYIEWEAIDNTHAKATITYNGTSASGIFTFDNNGLMLNFRTSDRGATEMDGTTRSADWSAICSNYEEVNGVKLPTALQGVWHYPEGDFLYFDGKNVEYVYY
jgi:hypothetical protein